MKRITIAVSIAIFSMLTCSVLAVESNRVAIVVNKYLKQEIEDNLNIYLQDLKNEGYEPVLKEWDLENDPAPQALKAYLKGLYLGKQGLQGAVFIGDLPIPIMEAYPILRKSSGVDTIHIFDGYIAEQYYMDLVGKEWMDTDGNYKFEEPYDKTYWESFWNIVEYYTPEMLKKSFESEDLYVIPEIWTSRIVTSTLTDLFKQSEGQLVNAYLKKNHMYRTGEIVFQKQALVYSLPDEMMENEFIKAKLILFNKYDFKELAPTTIDEFFKPLDIESYEILFWLRHGMKTYINLGDENLTSNWLRTSLTNVKTAFVFPISCWIGHYTEPSYFSGTYLFNDRYYVLGMVTATLPVYTTGSENSVMSEFIKGRNLGLAFKEAMKISDIRQLRKLASNFESSNSKFILGDGTLKLQSKKLVANEDNSPQKYLNGKYSYNEEFFHSYLESKSGSVETEIDVEL